MAMSACAWGAGGAGAGGGGGGAGAGVGGGGGRAGAVTGGTGAASGAAAICGTDVHIYNWDQWAQKTVPVPMVTGHEFVGTVADVGAAVTE